MSLNPQQQFGEFVGRWDYKSSMFVVIVAKEMGWWHMSISHASRDLTYEEIKAARYNFLPHDINVAMIFPPEADFVNVHKFCFHLWEI
jgi:hypothetical protein